MARRIGSALRWLLWPVLSAIAQESAPVLLDGHVLWSLQAGRPGFTVAERARDIGGNLQYVASDPRRQLDDVREIDAGTETILLVGRVYLFSVTDEDARLDGKPREQVFAQHRELALRAIRSYRDARQYSALVRTALLTIAAIAGLLVALRLFWIAYVRASTAIEHRLSRLLSVRGASVDNVFRGPLLIPARFLLKAGFLAISLIAAFASVSYVLSLIPPTVSLSEAIQTNVVSVVRGLAGTCWRTCRTWRCWPPLDC